MARFSVCIEMIFGEVEFADRIAKVKQAGLDAFEFWNTSNKDLAAVKRATTMVTPLCSVTVATPRKARPIFFIKFQNCFWRPRSHWPK